MKDLNDYAKQCHAANIKWWQNPETGNPIKRNKGELIALMHSELSECLEGERKSKGHDCPLCNSNRTIYVGMDLEEGAFWDCLACGKRHSYPPEANVYWMDDKLPDRKMAEVELADALIRIFDYAGAFGYDLQGAFEEKMAFNATREDHKHEARKIAGGKQF